MPVDEFEQGVVDLRVKLLAKAKIYYFGDIFAAEDLVSNTMLCMLRNRDKFEAGTNMNAWGHIILKNTFVNEYRKKLVIKEGDYETATNTVVSNTDNADEELKYKDIRKFVDGLRETLRIPFDMSVSGFKYEEIAEQLELPIGTIKSRIFLARQILIDQINGLGKIKEFVKKPKTNCPKVINNNKSNNNQITTIDMGTKIDKTESLKKFFAMIFELSNNRWIDVKDHPITPMYIKCGLDHNWGAPINQVLKTNKLFMTEGNKSGLRYRASGDVIPDYDTLAQEAIVFKSLISEKYNKVKVLPLYGQQEEPKKFVKDKAVVSEVAKEMNRPQKPKAEIAPKVTRRTHFDIDQRCFWLNPQLRSIQEVEISGVYKEEDDEDHIEYWHHINKGGGQIEKNIRNTQLFETAEQLVECLLRGVIKFKK